MITLKTTIIKENISLDFDFKKIDGRRNYFIEETKQRDLMSRNNKQKNAAINDIEQLLILVSAIRKCVSVSPLLYLLVFLEVLQILK